MTIPESRSFVHGAVPGRSPRSPSSLKLASAMLSSIVRRLALVLGGSTKSVAALGLEQTMPGGISTGRIHVANTSASLIKVVLVPTTLFGDEGGRIPGSDLGIIPDTFDLAAGETMRATITVRVPADARPGHYVGVISVHGRPSERILVVVPVGT
jgi:hypothetical protein